MENKERFETKRDFKHKFKVLGTNTDRHSFVLSFINFITGTINRRQQLKWLYQLAKAGNSK